MIALDTAYHQRLARGHGGAAGTQPPKEMSGEDGLRGGASG